MDQFRKWHLAIRSEIIILGFFLFIITIYVPYKGVIRWKVRENILNPIILMKIVGIRF